MNNFFAISSMDILVLMPENKPSTPDRQGTPKEPELDTLHGRRGKNHILVQLVANGGSVLIVGVLLTTKAHPIAPINHHDGFWF
jgi:hypothetical protein